jgi:hypothetical protein
MICMVASGNGVQTGTAQITMIVHRWWTRPVLHQGVFGCCEAVLGFAMAGMRVRRIVAASIRPVTATVLRRGFWILDFDRSLTAQRKARPLDDSQANVPCSFT